MRKIILTVLVCVFAVGLKAQQLAAFNDYLEQFWVFDGGTFQQLEHIEIRDFQVGGYYVAYIDNRRNLKVYRNGEINTLLSGHPIQYEATDYLLGYSLYEQLNVYDNGENRLLSMECTGYVVQDSLIAWQNRIRKTTQVYYDGDVYTIEDGLIYDPIKDFKTGDNTLVWIQKSTRELKLFYQGEIIILEPYWNDLIYEAGRDIVAYVNLPDPTFRAFYKGDFYEIDDFQPKSFKVGDEMVAFVDNMNRLKYFDGGEVVTLSTFEPQFYDVVDRVVIFEEQGLFKTYCNGNVYIIERFIPSMYKVDFNTIAYLDQSNFVKAFSHCERIDISYEQVKEIRLIRDLVIFVTGVNRANIYFMGQIFQK